MPRGLRLKPETARDLTKMLAQWRASGSDLSRTPQVAPIDGAETRIVQIVNNTLDSSGNPTNYTPGDMVGAVVDLSGPGGSNRGGYFYGRVLQPENDHVYSSATAYSALDVTSSAWHEVGTCAVIVINRRTGSVDDGARLTQGDRYIGRRIGSYFSPGVNTKLPLYAIETGDKEGVPFYNTSNETVPARGCIKIVYNTQFNNHNGVKPLIAVKPDTNFDIDQTYAVNSSEPVPSGGFGVCYLDGVVECAYGGSLSNSFGNMPVGPKPGSWLMADGYAGFWGLNMRNDSNTVVRCLFERPMTLIGKAVNILPTAMEVGSTSHAYDIWIFGAPSTFTTIPGGINYGRPISPGKWIMIHRTYYRWLITCLEAGSQISTPAVGQPLDIYP